MERLNGALIVGEYKGENTNPTNKWFVLFRAFYACFWSDYNDIVLWDERSLDELKTYLSRSIIEKFKIQCNYCPVEVVTLTRLGDVNSFNTNNRRSQ